MKQKIITTLLIILIFGLNCYSQVPGYMGHRFSVEGNINILPSFVNAARGYNSGYSSADSDNIDYYTSSNGSNNYPTFSMNFSKSFSVNYSIRKKIDVGLRVNYSNGNYKLIDKSDISNYSNYQQAIAFSIHSQSQLRPYHLLDYNLNFKFYLGNYIAPVGNYILVGIGIIDVRSTTKIKYSKRDYSEYYYEEIQAPTSTKLVDLSEKFIKTSAGFYRKKFITEKVYINSGFEFNFIFLGLSDQRFYDIGGYSTNIRTKGLDDLIDKTYRLNIGRHLAIENRYNFKIGLGIIL